VDAQWAEARSYAEDAEGSYAGVYAEVDDGSIDTFQRALAGNSAAAGQNTEIYGDFAWALCEAYNPDEDYRGYVDNWVDGNAYLDFEGRAFVNSDEARAYQRSHAEGDRIWPYADSTNDHDEEDIAGSFDFEAWAWTNGTSEGAVVEVVVV
jgi:hypothetical protein